MLSLLNIISCGKSETPTVSTEPQNVSSDTETEKLLTDGLPDTDMKGFSFNLLHHDNTWLTWAKTQLSAEEENGELINDAIFKRNSYIEERFNCKLNLATTDQTAKVFKSLVMSGSTDYDIIFQYGLNVLGNIDYLADFDNIPHLNLDDEWWNPNATDVFRVGDKQLAIAGNLTLSYLSGATTFVFNKEIYSDIRIKDDIYKLVDDGKWTTDKFYDISRQAARDLNGDSIIDTSDLIGITGSAKGYYNTLIIGACFKYVDFDKDHKPYFNMPGNEKMINFFQKIVDTETVNPYI
jgi:ABC-type glycerol-3-phosphate transport system substrate-binding protein